MANITKKLLIFTLVAVLFAASVGTVAAKPKGNPKGEITAVDETAGTLTLQTEDGEIVVHLPDGFDYGSVEKSQFVLVKGNWLNETEIEAEWVKTVDEEDTEDPEESEEQEGEDFHSPWCSGKKDGVHPVVAKIAEKYGPKTEVTEEQVHTWFCEGHSVGQIMLALTTQLLDGSDPVETLAARKDGNKMLTAKGGGRSGRRRN